MKDEHAIVIEQLTKTFGDFTAVDHVTFNVDKGEIFGLLGANGAGKTTLIKMLTGLIKPSSGRAVVNGLDVNTQSEAIKKQIGYMSQKFSLYEDLTVRENIELFGGIYRLGRTQIRQRTDTILSKLALTDEKNTLIRNLPVGWRQKLSFCTAMIHDPRIVYLDEPTSGVDPAAIRQFWSLMDEAAQNDTTIVLTTHNLTEAEYCDRVCVMVDGRVVECASPATLKSKYSGSDMTEVFEKIADRNTP